MNSLPYVSVIIVNYNGKRWLEIFFGSVINSNYSKLEVILIDNGSTDGSDLYIREKYKRDSRVKVIENGINLGYASAVNVGLKMANGEVLFVICNDVEVHPNCINEIVKVLSSDRRIGFVQPRVISIKDRKTLDSGLNYLDIYGYSYGYVPFSKKPAEVTFTEGIAWATRRDVIERIGKMEEYYFMEYDDQDICWRALLSGYKNLFIPDAIVYHVRGGTQGKTFFDRTENAKWYVTNHVVTLIKNLQLVNLGKVLSIVIIIEIGKSIYLFGRNSKVLALNTLKGLFIVLRDIELILNKRHEIQNKVRTVSDSDIKIYFHPFKPGLLINFLSSQRKGERFILNIKPPIEMLR